MIAKTSPLKLKRFILFDLNYGFSIPKNTENKVTWEEVLADYPIHIDFDHFQNDEGVIEVRVSIEVNKDKEMPGLALHAEGVGAFMMDPAHQLEEGLANNLRIFSSLNICINAIRNEFATITSQSPIGSYYLPAIDIANLIEQKQKEPNTKS